ncbi:hypothetical protein Tco_0133243 [Tanacetum coccineum]
MDDCGIIVNQLKILLRRVPSLFPEFDVHRFEEETQPGMVSCEDAAKRLIWEWFLHRWRMRLRRLWRALSLKASCLIKYLCSSPIDVCG